MKEIKVFARAGQGAITTVGILGEALFLEGKFSYAFPHFGAARMGAPMNAFLRFDDRKVRLRSQVYNPDYVIVVDPTLIKTENCFSGMKKNGIAIVSVRDNPENISYPSHVSIFNIPAEKIALEVIGKPFSNTVLLGAFSAATGVVSLESLNKSLRHRFAAKPEVLDKNIEAMKRGYRAVLEKTSSFASSTK